MFEYSIIEALCDRFGYSEKYLQEIAEAKEFYLFFPDGQEINKCKIPDSFRGENFEPEYDFGEEEYGAEVIIIEHTLDYIELRRKQFGASFFVIDKYIGIYATNLNYVINGEAYIEDFELRDISVRENITKVAEENDISLSPENIQSIMDDYYSKKFLDDYDEFILNSVKKFNL